MEPIIVMPHGRRWAVRESPDSAPIAEFDTRELAEIDARQRASGREVIVREDAGDESLGRVEEPDVEGERPRTEDAGIHERNAGTATGSETPREPQAGL